ncbi:hypothetical protein FRAAL4201 [Frankia alni ACN14a]|uniref:Uncharacterized protein n=1 Tax=Frankia alni (strain DSM 45986 / CECT 9034 / ACN14a) TaxID=326424 RepID=Q0RI29_FRAAA|nr:hypothetical protein FRAAL4201 [Frankia alni ACN14a]
MAEGAVETPQAARFSLSADQSAGHPAGRFASHLADRPTGRFADPDALTPIERTPSLTL